MIILRAFLALVSPISTAANPACIKKTRHAARIVQVVLILAWVEESLAKRIFGVKQIIIAIMININFGILII